MLWMGVVNQYLFYGAELCKVLALQGGSARRPRMTEGSKRRQ
jgi:hypothetical protein